MPVVDSLLSVRQLSRVTGLSARTIRRMIVEQRTPEPVRIGRSVRFRASEVDLWLKLGCPDQSTFKAANAEGVERA